MQHIDQILRNWFPVLFGLSLLWIAGWILASVVYRRSAGKPVLFWSVPNAAFVETRAFVQAARQAGLQAPLA